MRDETLEAGDAGSAETAERADRRRLRATLAAIPVVLFVTIAAMFYVALRSGDPATVPSALIGYPAPQFALAPLEGLHRPDGTPVAGFSSRELAAGRVSVVNVWASWCGPCRAEHPYLVQLGEAADVQLLGLNYKDAPANARRFLGMHGNPFDAVGVDASGRAAIDWGVYGVPETFVVDGNGTIRFKHVGPITEDVLEQHILPAIASATAAGPDRAGGG